MLLTTIIYESQQPHEPHERHDKKNMWFSAVLHIELFEDPKGQTSLMISQGQSKSHCYGAAAQNFWTQVLYYNLNVVAIVRVPNTNIIL